MEKQAEQKLTDNGRMNIWIGERIKAYRDLINQTGENQNRAYLQGVLAGISLLQDAWLNDVFKEKRRNETRRWKSQ